SMVTLRARRALRTPPSTETADSTPSLIANDEEDCKRQVSTIQQTALRLPEGMIIDGEHWPPIFCAENVRSAKALKPRPDDVFICTYPKCGTTWIQHIVHQLLGKTDYEAAVDDDENDNVPSSSAEHGDEKKDNMAFAAMCFVSPMIERMGAAYSDTITTPRVLKSHFTYGNIPKGGAAKYIYAVRNPKDCLTSYFHHNRNFKIYNFEHGEFDVFFELFMQGKVGFGDYFDHLTSWLEGIDKAEEKILFLKYEDMVADLRSSVVKIAEFLGGKSAEMIRNEQELTRIVEASTLSSMKKNQQRWFPNKQLHRGEFIRKGGSRDWKNQFSSEQSRRMDTRFRQRCAATAAAEWWHTEMAWNLIRPLTSIDVGSEVSSYASSATSAASPLSFTSSSSSIDFSSRFRLLSINPDLEGCYSPMVEESIDRDRVDSLQFPFESLRTEGIIEEQE
ncbi:hypothetical protein PFISCL1PPCAC_2695, partial [Pristionchus fissidentatus]